MNRLNTKYNISDWDSERHVDQLIIDSDDTYMPCPTIDSEPDLLISKVRQHYMKHMVKLLSVNYETNQKLLNKNIYLPSGIWRCAQVLEMKAARKSMVIQLYRANILSEIKRVKSDTEKGRLYRNLLEAIRTPPSDKKTQTSIGTDNECDCKCHINNSKKRRKSSPQNMKDLTSLLQQSNAIANPQVNQYKIPVAINMQTHAPEPMLKESIGATQCEPGSKVLPLTVISSIEKKIEEPISFKQTAPIMTPLHPGNDCDDIMMQLEKLFHTDQTDDDLFDATFSNTDAKTQNETVIEDISQMNDTGIYNQASSQIQATNNAFVMMNDTGICNQASSQIQATTNAFVIENHAAQIKSLDERLATLTGILINNETNTPDKNEERAQNNAHREKEIKKKKIVSRWHCEEYFLKKELLETLYQIGDSNRNKLARIKTLYLQLFGEDDEDDEGILLSPIEDSPRMVLSCKTRISMWVLTTLTPYYGMGRIRGKTLFKSVVKYLIALIFKCKKYPDEAEVTNFVKDFIQNHAMITCEADYRDIIDNFTKTYP